MRGGERPGWPVQGRPAVSMSAGTSSGRTQSAVLVPVPEADEVVGRWRHEHDPVAAAGVPAHITLIVPWLPPGEITGADLADLDEMLEDVKAFEFVLDHVDWFGRRVLWVAPEPAAPFLRLTDRLADHFGTPPWDDEFDEVIPHLTVAHASDGVELQPVAADLSGRLPVGVPGRGGVGDGRRRDALGAPAPGEAAGLAVAGGPPRDRAVGAGLAILLASLSLPKGLQHQASRRRAPAGTV